jgi:chromate transporter
MIATLLALGLILAELSLLSFGGGISVLPDMQRQVVDVHHWMTAEQFSAAFALAQSAPGPNMMYVSLIGWRVAGWGGVIVATLATFGPTSLVSAFVYRVWQRFKDRPWRRLVQTGLQPITAGLVVASAGVITAGTATTAILAGITATTAVVVLTTRVHPLILLTLGALAGLIGGEFLPG